MYKKIIKINIFMFSLLCLFLLTGCDLLSGLMNNGSNGGNNVVADEDKSSTGKWYLLNDNKEKTNTYFEFDGSKGVMSFKYYDDNVEKYNGKYRVTISSTGSHTFTWILTRNGADKEDWISCYADDYNTNFTQFTTIKEEQNLGMIEGNIYAHIYRISELPYKLGTYVLDNNNYKQEKDNYDYANRYQVPEGKYILNNDVYIMFVMPKNYMYALFQYKNGDTIVEGVYYTADDKKTIYLFIEHDPYDKVKKSDNDKYDTTFSIYYPPDFYLRGNFEVNNDSIIINDLYHHDYSPTEIEDSAWNFGTYTLNK